jgi:hypothetical protein
LSEEFGEHRGTIHTSFLLYSLCDYNHFNIATQERPFLACPFFIPTERADHVALPHPGRLPLGAAWRGTCASAGHESAILNNHELESCNLGYAKSCPRLPKERPCDAVRFGVAKESSAAISLHFVLESDHLPTGSGLLQYDRRLNSWTASHPEPRMQRLAESFLQAYLERRKSSATFIPST